MITKKDSVYELTHYFGGNGWAVVQWLPGEFCHITTPYKPQSGRLFCKVRVKMLSLAEQKKKPVLIKPGELAELSAISKDLESGKAVIENSRLRYL